MARAHKLDAQLHTERSNHGDCMSHATAHPLCETANEPQARMVHIPVLARARWWYFVKRAELDLGAVPQSCCMTTVVSEVQVTYVSSISSLASIVQASTRGLLPPSSRSRSCTSRSPFHRHLFVAQPQARSCFWPQREAWHL